MKTKATYRDWVTFFSVTLHNDVRENILESECGALPAIDELLSFLATLTHGTQNDADMPEALTSAFVRIANHLGDAHGIDLPNGRELTDAESDSLSRVMFALMPDVQFIIMDARSAYPSIN